MEDRDRILQVLEEESRKRRSQMRGLIAAWLGITAGFAVLLFLSYLAKGPIDGTTMLIVGCAFAGVPTMLTMTSRHQQALREAARLDDPRLVPGLLDALDSDHPPIRRAVKDALRRLLPKVDVTQCADFDARHRHFLTGLLRGRDTELIRGAIHVLGLVGDQAALVDLDRVAKQRPLESQARAATADIRLRVARQTVSASEDRNEPTSA